MFVCVRSLGAFLSTCPVYKYPCAREQSALYAQWKLLSEKMASQRKEWLQNEGFVASLKVLKMVPALSIYFTCHFLTA